MADITRRGFVGSAVTAGLMTALTGCAGGSGTSAGSADTLLAPDASEYPIDPDGSDVAALYSAEDTGEGWTRYTQDNGAEIGLADTSKLIQVDGLAFRDLNGNGKLDLWEDWRQDSKTRAEALAAEMDVNYALRQMISGAFSSESGSMGGSVGEFDDYQKSDIDSGFTNRIMMTFTTGAKDYVPWFNEMQAYAESKNYSIPVVFECEAFLGMESMGIGGTLWPSSPTLAASFDKETVRQMADDLSTVLRGYGATKPNSPQTDVGTEPTWDRNSGTWSDDPALARDMANGFISGCQSTYDDDGNDLGWGKHSVLCNMKHFPGDGAAQFGGNSHNRDGRFDIYPNNNNRANWVPFIDGALNLDSKTGQCASAMPFYSIAYSEDGSYGELVGGGYSEWIMNVGRAYGYEGMYSSDWEIIETRCWGVEDKTSVERVAKTFESGMCLLVDGTAQPLLDDAYTQMQADMGGADAEARVRDAVAHIERTTMDLGIFENPYLTVNQCKEDTDVSKYTDFLHETLLKGFVMLKNTDDTISSSGIGADAKVYVPVEYSKGGGSFGFMMSDTNASAELPVDEETLAEHFALVTDTVGDPTGSPTEEGGEAQLQESDITRATADDLADVDYALIFVDSPSTSAASVGNGGSSYAPRSLQYREFVADDASGCPEEGLAGVDASQSVYENLSPYGNSSVASNEGSLDLVISTKENLPKGAKLILVVNTSNPVMCWHEIEPYADVIFWTNSNKKANVLEILDGTFEPTGLLPWQQPKDMRACYTSATDTPRDLDCYTDANGSTYDFGFGMNWSGVISDDRTAKYCVKPLLEPDMDMVDSSLLIR